MRQFASTGGAGTRRLRSYARSAFFTGLTITVPVLVTILVLYFAIDFLSGLLDPLVILVQSSLGLDGGRPRYVVEVVALVVLAAVIFLVGAFAETEYGGGAVERRIETAMINLPGIGSLYESVNEISDMVLARDTDSFQEVKLVEYPREDSYSIAFVTAEAPEVVGQATGHDEMITLFMPMAPNPVMGGFVIHVSEDRVYDVDMSVEEGIKAIVSSGVAVNEPETGSTDGQTPVEGA